MNKEINDPDVRKKYGENVILTKENIKDIYYLTYCNTFPKSEYIEWFLKKHYKKDEILSLNNEYTNLKLDDANKLLNLEMNFDNVWHIFFNITEAINIYKTNKDTYIRIIKTLKEFFNKYGYFTLYNVLDLNNCKYGEFPFRGFVGSIIEDITYGDFLKKEKMSSGSIYHYLKNLKYVGLIPSLYYLGYIDLLNQVVKEIVIPSFKHFLPESEIMKENGLNYIPYESDEPKDLFLYREITEFSNYYNLNLDLNYKN